MSNDFVTIGDGGQSIAEVIAYIQDMGKPVDRAARIALPKIGQEVLRQARQKAPRSAVHRGPGRSRKQQWRNPFVHAADTLKVSPVRVDKQSGEPMVMVGPARGDNSPSFYLKFAEYGSIHQDERPFLRPARYAVLHGSAAQIMTDAINDQIAKGRY